MKLVWEYLDREKFKEVARKVAEDVEAVCRPLASGQP